MGTSQAIALDIVKRAIIRFLKGFFSGGLSAITVIQPPLSSDPHAIMMWLQVTVSAFLVGGILGLEKLLTQIYETNSPTPLAIQAVTTQTDTIAKTTSPSPGVVETITTTNTDQTKPAQSLPENKDSN